MDKISICTEAVSARVTLFSNLIASQIEQLGNGHIFKYFLSYNADEIIGLILIFLLLLLCSNVFGAKRNSSPQGLMLLSLCGVFTKLFLFCGVPKRPPCRLLGGVDILCAELNRPRCRLLGGVYIGAMYCNCDDPGRCCEDEDIGLFIDVDCDVMLI